MKKFFRTINKYWNILAAVGVTGMFFIGTLSTFQALGLLLLILINVQIEKLVVLEEVKRQYKEWEIRASKRRL